MVLIAIFFSNMISERVTDTQNQQFLKTHNKQKSQQQQKEEKTLPGGEVLVLKFM